MIKFYWNGIKGQTGKLQRCIYSNGNPGMITIFARDYGPLTDDIRAVFNVEDDTEIISDYIDKDRIRVTPDHPLYSAVFAAFAAMEAHYRNRLAKRRAQKGLKAASKCARLLALNLAHHQGRRGEIPLDDTLALLDSTNPNN